MNKVGIIGNFGNKKKQIDGQTFRTRLVRDEFSLLLGKENIFWSDTSFLSSNPIKLIIEIKSIIQQCNNVVIMPGRRGLKILFPYYKFIGKKYKTRLHYLVVGGWLPKFLQHNKKYIKLLSEIDGLYVQTQRVKDELNEMGLSNVSILPNFRRFDGNYVKNKHVNNYLKLVYFSRIIKEKGVEIAIDAVKNINSKYKQHKVTLDIWGPIGEKYEDEFFEIMNSVNNYSITYKGFLEPNKIYDTLSNYDIMVFPTYYQGEGFPGAILDAYISGIPVIASDWQDNAEFIEPDITGFLFEAKSSVDFEKVLNNILDNKLHDLEKMSENCRVKSSMYHVDNIIPNLLKEMKISI